MNARIVNRETPHNKTKGNRGMNVSDMLMRGALLGLAATPLYAEGTQSVRLALPPQIN